MLWGSAVLGFFFLLRRSEYLAASTKVRSKFIMRVADVKCLDRHGRKTSGMGSDHPAVAVEVTIRGSKNDQVGKGETRTLRKSQSVWCCPVEAAIALLHHCRTNSVPDSAPISSVTPKRAVLAHALHTKIKEAATKAGQDASRYGTHSLRSGGATALFKAKVSGLAIKIFGRWKSSCVEMYTRICDEVSDAMAEKMCFGNNPRAIETSNTSSTAHDKSTGMPPRPHPGWRRADASARFL